MAHDRSEWTRGPDGPIKLGKKTYKNLVEFSRNCVTCEKRFSIFVTEKIAAGLADSNSFGLKNCEDHRRSAVRADDPEVAELRMSNRVMQEELKGCYATIREQQAKLAQYELQPAMAAVANGRLPWE